MQRTSDRVEAIHEAIVATHINPSLYDGWREANRCRGRESPSSFAGPGIERKDPAIDDRAEEDAPIDHCRMMGIVEVVTPPFFPYELRPGWRNLSPALLAPDFLKRKSQPGRRPSAALPGKL